jgi:hypothetical protein
MSLANADRTGHMVKLDIVVGGYAAGQTRLWKAAGRRLETVR